MKNQDAEKTHIVFGVMIILVGVILFFVLKEDLFSMFIVEKVGTFILINQTLSLILSLLLIVLFFCTPFLIRKFNLFGLKQRILFG
jgi:hypothetical protein